MTAFDIILSLYVWITVIIGLTFSRAYLLEVKHYQPIWIQRTIVEVFPMILHGALLFDVQDWREYFPLMMFQLSSYFLVYGPLLAALRRMFNPTIHGFWHADASSGLVLRVLAGHKRDYQLLYVGAAMAFILSTAMLYMYFGA